LASTALRHGLSPRAGRDWGWGFHFLSPPAGGVESGDERWGSWRACAGVLRRRMTRRRKGSS